MAINFPSSPSNGTIHTEADVTWVYDGTSWKSTGYAALSGALGSLTDVTLSSVQTGQLLSYSGSSWGNASLSLNGLSDVDLATTPPTDGQTLVWDNTAGVWEPGTITGGVGSEVDTLDSVTTRGDTTTNDINVGGVLAGGLKLNVNHTGSPTATVGDIKRINEHPHYYDGTTWRPFYLSGTSLSAVTSDVQFEDVQVRLTGFQNGRESDNYIYNYVNGKYFAIYSGAQVVSSPVKYGTNAIQFDGGTQSFIRSRSTSDSGIAPFLWSSNADWWSYPGTRGGFPDVSGDWTFETWVRFDELDPSTTSHGIFSISNQHGTSGEGKGVGLSLENNGLGYYALVWYNALHIGVNGVNPDSYQLSTYTNLWQVDTWYHISLSRRASDGRLFCHINGTYQDTGTDHYDTNLNDLAPSNLDDDYDFRIGNNWTLDATWTNNSLNHYLEGYLDDIRWTDYQRYDDTNYTAPTEAYPITAPAPPTVDPDWSNVKLRLPFDTNFNDVSSYEETPVISSSDVEIVPTTVKYGSGATRISNDGRFIRFAEGASHLSLGSSTWTVEFWINFDSLPSYNSFYGGRSCIFSNSSDTSSTQDLGFGIWSVSSDNSSYRFYWRNAASASTIHEDNIPSSLLLGQYNHVAVVRDSNDNIKVWLNGYLLKHDSVNPYTDFLTDTGIPTDIATSNQFRFGYPDDTVNAGENGFDGYVDDFRFTSTVKYTDHFTPPSGPLPTTGTVTADPGTPTTQSVGLTERTALQGSVTLDNNDSGNLNITGYKAYTLLKVETDADAWVRIYTDDAARTADQSRNEGSDPVPGSGVIAETRGSGVIQLNPAPLGYNNDSPNITDTIYTAVTNRSGAAATINVTLTAIRLEA